MLWIFKFKETTQNLIVTLICDIQYSHMSGKTSKFTNVDELYK